MATYTSTAAATTAPVAGHGFAKNKKQASGIYTVAASLAPADIIQLVRVPRGAIVTGGYVWGTKLESTSSGAALDIDIGYEANGVDAADPDAFGNLGVLITAAVSGVKPEADVFMYPLAGVLLTGGPKTLAAETVIGLTVVASTASWTSGTVGCVVDYELP